MKENGKKQRLTNFYDVYHRVQYKAHNHQHDKASRISGIQKPLTYKKGKPSNSKDESEKTQTFHKQSQEALCDEQLTPATIFFPHTHRLLVKNGHGGHGEESS